MKIVKQSFELLTPIDREEILKRIELAGRTCYKSEAKITTDSASEFVRKIVKTGHYSVIEHVSLTLKFITNRGVTHELVRHRLASYSQESTRYCNYGKNGELTFVYPHWWDDDTYLEKIRFVMKQVWTKTMVQCESDYLYLTQTLEMKPQDARGVMPNDLKTEIVVTANLREWKHIFELRTSPAAHPDIRLMLQEPLKMFKEQLPEIF